MCIMFRGTGVLFPTLPSLLRQPQDHLFANEEVRAVNNGTSTSYCRAGVVSTIGCDRDPTGGFDPEIQKAY